MKFVLDEKILLGEGIFTKIFHATIDSESVAAKTHIENDLLAKEAHFLKLCNHPNVIKHKGLIEYENQSYLIMELALAGSLQDHLGLSKFDLHQKLSFVRQICLGLSHIHSKHIVHGDIKPGHILFKNFQQIAIADFSMAQELTVGVPRRLGLGIVPEAEYTFQSDVYLLALVAYQIFEDRKHVSRVKLGDEIREAANRPGGLNRSIFVRRIWERTIVNSLQQNPEHRPTPIEFHDAFGE